MHLRARTEQLSSGAPRLVGIDLGRLGAGGPVCQREPAGRMVGAFDLGGRILGPCPKLRLRAVEERFLHCHLEDGNRPVASSGGERSCTSGYGAFCVCDCAEDLWKASELKWPSPFRLQGA